jgi:tetratricopeptide (TPR) repeat protein
MPFGRKAVGHKKVPALPLWRARTVDFDRVYERVFKPAIAAVELPEGGRLVPRRADEDLLAGIISEEMFGYLEYSRIVLADISAQNANVFYELGVRHRARESGTAIFRQADAAMPFDINQVRAFPYEYQPESSAARSRDLIVKVLRESLAQLRVDSPVQVALGRQKNETDRQPALEALLRGAEEDLAHQDRPAAASKYEQAVSHFNAGALVKLRLAIMYRDLGRWEDARQQLLAVTEEMPSYAEAHRELGIVENKRYQRLRLSAAATGEPTGEDALRRAIALAPNDYDALASLGGILKREGNNEEAFAMYRRATEASAGHPYPLLNAIKLQALATGRLVLDERTRAQLQRAERMRAAQAEDRPPSDAPWCFFDLAEIRLYLGDGKGFTDTVDQGISHAYARWQLVTFRESLALLGRVPEREPIEEERLFRALERLTEAEHQLIA